MSIIDKVKALIAESHATGYASELPASVTRVFDELAAELEKLHPLVGAGAATLTSIEQLATTLRGEVADAIAAAIAKVEQDLDGKLAAAETAISGRLAEVFKEWAAKQVGADLQLQPATPAAPAVADPQPAAAAAAPAAPAEAAKPA